MAKREKAVVQWAVKMRAHEYRTFTDIKDAGPWHEAYGYPLVRVRITEIQKASKKGGKRGKAK